MRFKPIINHGNEHEEVSEIFKILELYYHTDDEELIKQHLSDDFMSEPHAARLLAFFAGGESILLEAVIIKFGSKFINRRMINIIRKCR